MIYLAIVALAIVLIAFSILRAQVRASTRYISHARPFLTILHHQPPSAFPPGPMQLPLSAFRKPSLPFPVMWSYIIDVLHFRAIVGNLLNGPMIGTNPRVATALQSKYGPILGFRNGPFSCVITQTPEITTELFVKNSTKVNGRPADVYFDVFAARSEATGNVGTGIVFATAERWRENRKFALMKVFGKDKVASLYGKMQDEVVDWIDWVDQSLIGKNKSADIEPHATISSLTMNIIGAITCDVRPSSAYASSRAELSPELIKLSVLIPQILSIVSENGAKMALVRLIPSLRTANSLGFPEWEQYVKTVSLDFTFPVFSLSSVFPAI
jgi:hypothetical protein